MEIIHISDTHGRHRELKLNLKGVDVIVHTGDESNNFDWLKNEPEFRDLIDWYGSLEIKNKILIAGNHSGFIAKYPKIARELMLARGITYLDKEAVVIDGVKFYGDPTSPRFGNWHFMADRNKMYKHWDLIPEDVNVLLTHTPPKGVLDIGQRQGGIEFCGCSSLRTKIRSLKELKAHCFGHIHSKPDYPFYNHGILKRDGVIYSNATLVQDCSKTLATEFGNFIKI